MGDSARDFDGGRGRRRRGSEAHGRGLCCLFFFSLRVFVALVAFTAHAFTPSRPRRPLPFPPLPSPRLPFLPARPLAPLCRGASAGDALGPRGRRRSRRQPSRRPAHESPHLCLAARDADNAHPPRRPARAGASAHARQRPRPRPMSQPMTRGSGAGSSAPRGARALLAGHRWRWLRAKAWTAQPFKISALQQGHFPEDQIPGAGGRISVTPYR